MRLFDLKMIPNSGVSNSEAWVLNGLTYFPQRYLLRRRNFGSKRSIAITAISVALLAATMITIAGRLPNPTSGDDINTRPVILVGDACTRNPAFSMAEIYRWLQDDLSLSDEDLILFDYRDTTPLVSTAESYAAADTLVSIDGVNGSAYYLREMINAWRSRGNSSTSSPMAKVASSASTRRWTTLVKPG